MTLKIKDPAYCRFCGKIEQIEYDFPFGSMRIYLCSKCEDLLKRFIKDVTIETLRQIGILEKPQATS